MKTQNDKRQISKLVVDFDQSILEPLNLWRDVATQHSMKFMQICRTNKREISDQSLTKVLSLHHFIEVLVENFEIEILPYSIPLAITIE